jgi:hypothetical protein
MSNLNDVNGGVVAAQQLEVARVVREDKSAAQPNCSGHNQGVDRHLAASVGVGEKVTGMPGDTGTGCDHASEPFGEDAVDWLVAPAAPIQLDQDGGGNSHGSLAPSC